ncbi:MAG TPA: HIT domain-containing protein [Candidatus Paceibacterota bacterium]|nr:HIT domain-containing protein [Candidatus Paceibacterota bacterium]
MLSESQIKTIKEQLLKQVEAWPEEQRESAKEQIEAMTDEELEEFLVKNNLIKSGNNENAESAEGNCIFCLINEGKVKSYKISENKEAIAILEINPISNGHVIIIPKNHISPEKMPVSTFTLAKKVAEKIKEKLKPKKVDILTGELFNHGIINVLPVYDKEHLGMPRKKASEEELKEIQGILSLGTKKEPKPKKSKPEKPKTKEELELEIKKLPKYPIRIP